jgi:hypothetical protein
MHTESNDIFEQRLDEAMKRLQQCQKEHSVASCGDCEKCIGCEVRQAYVQTVYDSMSKGETGGFEF